MGEKKGTKYGKQPFLDEIRAMGLRYRQAADLMGVPYLHLRHAGYGYAVAKYELRDALAEFLDRPVEDLFTEEMLAGVPHYGPRGRALMTETAEEKAVRLKRERAAKAARREAREAAEVS